MRAALLDEVLVGLIAVLAFAMALQTGVVALLALPLSRALSPLASVLDVGLVPLTFLALPLLLWAFVRLLYRVVGTGSPSGQTPGKRTAGLRVVDEGTGDPPGYRTAFVREGILLVLVLTVVGIAAALTSRPWHDAAAGTRLARAPQDARR